MYSSLAIHDCFLIYSISSLFSPLKQSQLRKTRLVHAPSITVLSIAGTASILSPPEPEYIFGEEAAKVLSDKWEGIKDSAATEWSAMPMVGDDASRAQARDDIVQGVKDTYQGLNDLAGPRVIPQKKPMQQANSGSERKMLGAT